ncbi:YesL family protein [Cohnella yongneupensis]|uniref:YesL family protein n=1 Tax=Cohnella yongneupensis TaxID=425006 RepID=A0ABW0R1R8_9BACL
MEMRGMMGGFYRLSEWVMRLSVTNVLWLVTALPFWYFALVGFQSLQLAETDEAVLSSFQTSVILLAVLAPFTLFPATSAMFSVARKWVLGDTDVPLLKTFFRNYKQNYVQSMVGGIFYALLFAIMIIDFRVYLTQIDGFQIVAYLFIALMALLTISLLHFFSLLSHFHMKTVQLIKNALILTIGRPFRSVVMAMGTAAVLYLSFKFTFLIPFFFGSIIAVYTFYNFNLVMQKMMSLKDALEAKQAEEAEEEEGKEA